MVSTRLLVLLAVVCAVNARSYPEPGGGEDAPTVREEPAERRARDHAAPRHRRKRWQTSTGYLYNPPAQPFDRQDFQEQDLLYKMSRLLDELTAVVTAARRPQPVYIPYPVPYPVPQYVACSPNTTALPGIPNRFPDLEDSNMNWGIFAPPDTRKDDDGGRPISFNPVTPGTPARGDTQSTTRATDVCITAILTCCHPTYSAQTQAQCFTSINCSKVYTPTVCQRDSVRNILDSLANLYAPK